MKKWQTDTLGRHDALAATKKKEFSCADPFPHCVIDDLFDPGLIEELVDEFPVVSDPIWESSNQERIQVKLRSNWVTEEDILPITRTAVHFLNSGAFMKRLSEICGIEKLISDPYYTGGGLNCTRQGGLLDVHVDGNWHHAMGVHRRLNAILYLNKEWKPEWGGQLELWDPEVTRCIKSIEPKANRLIIFETHDYTYHGHPTPLACPNDEARKSLILYYYTALPRPETQVVISKPHRALWRRLQLKELS